MKIHDDRDGKIDINDLSILANNVTAISKTIIDQYTIFDKVEDQRRLERDAVVNLAMKSFKGMK